ncbi:hypothetical protein T4B_1129 [Trichinella pseudospiralis]|uniref:Uncharacterized protein n=1 Tax=Trichinella pseudospiralis TaxID=6337 RepID=A0A0V1I0G3_TRIPS|nr:hypothetical protein T4B_1129 [Trichinella pseudospiralis]
MYYKNDTQLFSLKAHHNSRFSAMCQKYDFLRHVTRLESFAKCHPKLPWTCAIKEEPLYLPQCVSQYTG